MYTRYEQLQLEAKAYSVLLQINGTQAYQTRKRIASVEAKCFQHHSFFIGQHFETFVTSI